MAVQALEAPRFIRKTRLSEGEYHKNFQKLDVDVIRTISSAEADRVTPMMSKIYLRLTTAPAVHWEREGILRFEGDWQEGKHVKAWAVLCEVLGVASATASKALKWMHDAGVIGYFAGKNGVGIRIFLNRAASSVGEKPARGGEKILQFTPASTSAARGSRNEPAFNDSFAVSEVSETDLNPPAPKNGAADKTTVDKTSPESRPAPANETYGSQGRGEVPTGHPPLLSVDEIVRRIRSEIEPAVESAAQKAAHREHERTREWLENRGLPKAARVAQHEAYNVLRKYGVISESGRTSRAHAEVGRNDYVRQEPHALSAEEITEMAGVCVAMLETKGQAIEVTLSEMSADAGGFLLPEDAVRVREQANSLLSACGGRQGK